MTHDHKGHNHSASLDNLNRAFVVGIVLNLVFVAAEAAAGAILGSMALLSDAGHNLSDVAGLALSLLAFRLSRLKPTEKYTYGRKRSTIVASLANACILLVAVGFILFESIGKIRNPMPVEGGVIAWVAGVGIIVNTVTALLFMRHKDKDLNVRGAYLHMAADALVSAGVVFSGVAIQFTGLYIIDPLIGIVVAIVILVSTWGLLRESIRLSLDAVPGGIDPGKITEAILESDTRVTGVHHLHIWPLSTTENALTAHVAVSSADGSGEIKRKIKDALRQCGIGHATLEIEAPGDGCPEC